MSATDQAFIRAYNKDAATQSPSQLAGLGTSAPVAVNPSQPIPAPAIAAASSAAATEVAAPEVAASAGGAPSEPARPTIVFHAAQPVVPRPHFAPAKIRTFRRIDNSHGEFAAQQPSADPLAASQFAGQPDLTAAYQANEPNEHFDSLSPAIRFVPSRVAQSVLSQARPAVASPAPANSPVRAWQQPVVAQPAMTQLAEKIPFPVPASQLLATEQAIQTQAIKAATSQNGTQMPDAQMIEAIVQRVIAKVSADNSSAPAAELASTIAEKPAEDAAEKPAVQKLEIVAEQPPAEKQLAEKPAAAPAPPVFNPQWEVDRLRWPEICRRLTESRLPIFVEAVRVIAAAGRRGHKAIGVFTAEPGAGGTTMTLCLARRLAANGLRVGVIDGNFHSPAIAAQFGMSMDAGWEEFLCQRQPADEVTLFSAEDALTLAPLLRPVSGAQLMRRSDKIGEFTRCLAKAMDVLLVDCGHGEGTNTWLSAGANSSGLNAAILVASAIDHRSHEIAGVIETSSLPLLGVAENFAHATVEETQSQMEEQFAGAGLLAVGLA